MKNKIKEMNKQVVDKQRSEDILYESEQIGNWTFTDEMHYKCVMNQKQNERKTKTNTVALDK